MRDEGPLELAPIPASGPQKDSCQPGPGEREPSPRLSEPGLWLIEPKILPLRQQSLIAEPGGLGAHPCRRDQGLRPLQLCFLPQSHGFARTRSADRDQVGASEVSAPLPRPTVCPRSRATLGLLFIALLSPRRSVEFPLCEREHSCPPKTLLLCSLSSPSQPGHSSRLPCRLGTLDSSRRGTCQHDSRSSSASSLLALLKRNWGPAWPKVSEQ